MEEPAQGGKGRRKSWKWGVYLALGLLALGWLLNTPPGLLGKADAVGYAVCHRIDLRSFHLGDRQLPLCARCTGMFLVSLGALVYMGIVRPRRAGYPHWSIMVGCALLVAAFAIDGVNSFFQLIPGAPSIYEPQNWLRLLTGTGMGLVIAIVLYPSFNQTVWLKPDPRPALDNWKVLGGVAVLCLTMDILILSENPLVLYPLAIASAVGVLVLLMMVYTIVLLLVFRRENRAEHFSQLLVPMAGGLILALVQISLLDYGRFILTGTWEGFKLG